MELDVRGGGGAGFMKPAAWGIAMIGLLSAAPAFAADACSEENAVQQGQLVALRGEVVDLTCYMGQESRGKEHEGCTKACLMGGAPAGLLSENGSLYLLLEDHLNPKSYENIRTMGGDLVKVKGKVFKRGEILSLIVSKVQKG
jgi:hypothetical protein